MNRVRFLSKIVLAVSILLALALTFSCSSDSSDDDKTIAVNKFVAKPYSEGRTKAIKYSYSYDGYDFYYIYLGELNNIPLFYYASQHHNGMNSTYTVSTTETVKETIESSSQEAVTIIDEYTKTPDNAQASQSLGKKMFDFGVKLLAEELFGKYTETSEFKESKSKSLTNTISYGTEKTKATMESRAWNFTKDYREGYYRYTLFSTSDVYLYIIKDSKTGEIVDYEFKENMIPDAYFWRLDYSETPSFKKSDATSFEFDVSMLYNLPKPELTFTPSKQFCDFGPFDQYGGGCYLISNESECDTRYGTVRPSCPRKQYCDFGPVTSYGGGCFEVENASDCDLEWGTLANSCTR